MTLPAPGRCSTTIGCESFGGRICAARRAGRSSGPPGVAGTMILMVLAGSDHAAEPARAVTITNDARNLLRMSMALLRDRLPGKWWRVVMTPVIARLGRSRYRQNALSFFIDIAEN